MSELTQLAGTGNYKLEFQGKTYEFTPLKLADLSDLEAEFGMPLEDVFKASAKRTKVIAYVIWLALRRQGVTPEDIKLKKWSLTVDDVAELFDFNTVQKVLSAVMEASGMKLESEKNV